MKTIREYINLLVEDATPPARDPNKSYAKLDQEFRNRTKPRVDSVTKPDQFNFKDQSKIKGDPIVKNTRTPGGKNATTDRAEADQWNLSPTDKQFFDEFDKTAKSAISSLGLLPLYRRIDTGQKKVDGSKRYNYAVQTVINNVPVNIIPNTNVLSVDGLRKPEQKKAVYDAMLANGFELQGTYRNDALLRFNKPGADKYQALASAADIIESMGPDFKAPSRSGARSGMEVSSEPADYYYKLASGLVNTYSTGQGWALSRGGSESSVGGFDANDPVIITGYTRAGYKLKKSGSGTYREHAVPCDLINTMGIDICKDMNVPVAKNGRFTDEGRKIIRKATHVVMNMIQRNLLIVLCSTEEGKEILDKLNGWQTTMPSGWKEGDDPFARFTKAKLPPEYVKANKLDRDTGIAVYSVKDLDRIAEEDETPALLPPVVKEPISDNPKILGRTRRNAINEIKPEAD